MRNMKKTKKKCVTEWERQQQIENNNQNKNKFKINKCTQSKDEDKVTIAYIYKTLSSSTVNFYPFSVSI